MVNSTTRFLPSEVPSAAPEYPNAIPINQTLPASFFYENKPAWWPTTKPWPIIGPDVSGGNRPGYSGHVYTNPAMDCFLNLMHGPADGKGDVLAFDAKACYENSSMSAPAAPSRLTIAQP